MNVSIFRAFRSVVWLMGLNLLIPRIAASQEHLTTAERSGFSEYTSYEGMMSYLSGIQATTTEMRLGIYGESREGRELPYAIFSRPSITKPWEAWALGKPVLVLSAAVHGDEPTLRESVLILTRDFATPGTAMNDSLDELTVLIVPQINPDGFSAVTGPQRGNSWGLDLNRDYMKLEQPEIQGYVQNLLLPWAPHLFVDGHNGGAFPYNINYQCPSHPAPDPRITELCDERIFPAVDRKLSAEGFRSWYYQRGDATRWDVGGPDPRIGRNYGGFANMVGILFESEGSQPMDEAIRSGVLAYEAVVEWARDNSDLLMETVRSARLETLEMGALPLGDVPVEVEYAPQDEPVTYLIADGPPGAGGFVEVQSDSLMKRPVATLTRPRPWAYLLPPDAEEAVELLLRHGVQVETLEQPVRVLVDAYTIRDIVYEVAYNHEAAAKVEVAETVTAERFLSRGSFVVRTGQLQGRVTAHLLEAETRDGVAYWNRIDAWLPKYQLEEFKAGRAEAPLFPIFKLMQPTPLPTRLLE